jgi:hypothetical protein
MMKEVIVDDLTESMKILKNEDSGALRGLSIRATAVQLN